MLVSRIRGRREKKSQAIHITKIDFNLGIVFEDVEAKIGDKSKVHQHTHTHTHLYIIGEKQIYHSYSYSMFSKVRLMADFNTVS